MIQGTNKIYWMFYRLDVLQAYCLMFPHDFVSLNAVMFPMAKMFQGFFFDYKTTNGIFFFLSGLEELSMSGFPSVEAVLLWQSVFDFPNWLFHEYLREKQPNHNFPLSRVKCKVQDKNFNNIHEASQSKSCKFHRNILYF